ncbi:heavy metal-responsive transcriptional regulator [Acuticoccus sp. MNP-M23]|uniref:heavy metal-responsive transcriptional regulator n=1 Tax=Acuticoccus sp. MNP-M23 TaxID=3072793 RepID=UPI002814D1E1|nr:heavy metal-responsive transcriptional regulator [Acuticoccus sp. MNP-M23]WMS44404.1 heavy metal-responsive transcriptional regulator [Acuticoccus sp. MNP-M23]
MPLTIGQLAKDTGVTVDTIRFYERKGLLLPDDRTVANYRTYSAESLRRLKFIRKAQALGFTLEEVAELLTFGSSPESTAGDVLHATERKIEEQRKKIEQLSRLRDVLIELAAECDGEGPTEECPIINYFFDEDGNRLSDGHSEETIQKSRQLSS